MDPHRMTLVLALFALVVGAVVFGGTSLAYFLDQRRPDVPRLEEEPARPTPASAPPLRPDGTVPVKQLLRWQDDGGAVVPERPHPAVSAASTESSHQDMLASTGRAIA